MPPHDDLLAMTMLSPISNGGEEQNMTSNTGRHDTAESVDIYKFNK